MNRANWVRLLIGAAMAAAGYILSELGIRIPPLDGLAHVVRSVGGMH